MYNDSGRNGGYQFNKGVNTMNNSPYQQAYNQSTMKNGYVVQGSQQMYGTTPGKPMQTMNNQPYVLGQYTQMQQMGQYQTMNYQGKRPNTPMIQRYGQQSDYQRQQIYQNQGMVVNQGMATNQLHMQNRQLSPEQIAFQQQLKLQRMNQLQMQRSYNRGREDGSSEQQIHSLEFGTEFFDSQTQKRKRECNEIANRSYELFNTINRITKESKV